MKSEANNQNENSPEVKQVQNIFNDISANNITTGDITAIAGLTINILQKTEEINQELAAEIGNYFLELVQTKDPQTHQKLTIQLLHTLKNTDDFPEDFKERANLICTEIRSLNNHEYQEKYLINTSEKLILQKQIGWLLIGFVGGSTTIAAAIFAISNLDIDIKIKIKKSNNSDINFSNQNLDKTLEESPIKSSSESDTQIETNDKLTIKLPEANKDTNPSENKKPLKTSYKDEIDNNSKLRSLRSHQAKRNVDFENQVPKNHNRVSPFTTDNSKNSSWELNKKSNSKIFGSPEVGDNQLEDTRNQSLFILPKSSSQYEKFIIAEKVNISIDGISESSWFSEYNLNELFFKKLNSNLIDEELLSNSTIFNNLLMKDILENTLLTNLEYGLINYMNNLNIPLFTSLLEDNTLLLENIGGELISQVIETTFNNIAENIVQSGIDSFFDNVINSFFDNLF